MDRWATQDLDRLTMYDDAHVDHLNETGTQPSPALGAGRRDMAKRSFEPTAETIEWLLAGDPAIRWQTKHDVLGLSSAEVEEDRELVATTGWGRRLLDHQDPTGTWAGGLYGPKWTSTTYTLLLLRRLGLQPGHPDVLRGVKQIWDGARYFDGGLTSAVLINAPEACVTSMYVALARYFGFDDPRVDAAIDWLVFNQLADGGWNCRTVRFGDQHGSFHTSILALEALSEDGSGRTDVAAALASGQEFFLRHRLYRSHQYGTVANPTFTRLSFPPRWHYDVLRGLEHFRSVNSCWDERLDDALGVLVGKRRADNTWPVQNKHVGKVWFDMENSAGPSRWNTLRALRVLKWATEMRESC